LTRLERLLLAAVAAVVALAGLAHYLHWAPVARFALATVALAGLAWIVALAAEQTGRHLGPAATGLLQATLGNLPEIFVVAFALHHGQELVLAQTAIVGSLLANALLVLGAVIVVGASRAPGGVMRFGRRLPNDTATLMLITVFVIVLLGLLLASHAPAARHARAISAVGAACLLVVYLSWIVSYLRDDARQRRASARGAHDGRGGGHQEPPARLPIALALSLLAAAGVGSAFVAGWFVDALLPALSTLHLSQAFAGLVIVALAGNAVENASAVAMAWRGRFELAIAVVKSSIAQVSAFVFPLLVLVSLALPTTLTFGLPPVYVGALAVSAVAVWQVTGDGEAWPYEGLALIAMYVVVAVVAAFQ